MQYGYSGISHTTSQERCSSLLSTPVIPAGQRFGAASEIIGCHDPPVEEGSSPVPQSLPAPGRHKDGLRNNGWRTKSAPQPPDQIHILHERRLHVATHRSGTKVKVAMDSHRVLRLPKVTRDCTTTGCQARVRTWKEPWPGGYPRTFDSLACHTILRKSSSPVPSYVTPGIRMTVKRVNCKVM